MSKWHKAQAAHKLDIHCWSIQTCGYCRHLTRSTAQRVGGFFDGVSALFLEHSDMSGWHKLGIHCWSIQTLLDSPFVMATDPLAEMKLLEAPGSSSSASLSRAPSTSSLPNSGGHRPFQSDLQGEGEFGVEVCLPPPPTPVSTLVERPEKLYPNAIAVRCWPERLLKCEGCDTDTHKDDTVFGPNNPWALEPLPQEWGYYGAVKAYADIQPQGDLCSGKAM